MSARVFAAVMSAIAPGSGHFLLGERVRGLFAAILGGLLLLALPLAIVPMLWASLAVRVLAVGDVVVGVRTIRPMSKAGAAIAGGAPVAVLVLLWAFALSLYKIPASSMEPTLRSGQHVVVNRLAYLSAGPARGDLIVFANPCTPSKRFNKRVIGVAGDTIEVRCNVLYVNGAPVPSELDASGPCRYADHDDSTGVWREERCSRYRETLDGVSYWTLSSEDRPAEDEARRSGAGGDAAWHDFPSLEPGRAGPACAGRGAAAPGEIVRSRPEGAEPCVPQLHYVVPPGSVFVLGDNRDNSSDSRVWGSVPLDLIDGEIVLTVGAGGP